MIFSPQSTALENLHFLQHVTLYRHCLCIYCRHRKVSGLSMVSHPSNCILLLIIISSPNPVLDEQFRLFLKQHWPINREAVTLQSER